MRSAVVFPAPFGPSRPQTWPCSTWKLRSSTASTLLAKRFERPRTSTTGSLIEDAASSREYAERPRGGAYRDGPWTPPRRLRTISG